MVSHYIKSPCFDRGLTVGTVHVVLVAISYPL